MAEPGTERTTDRPAPVALGPDADRGAAEEAKFAELRSLLVGPERREVVDLKAHLADRHARTLDISGLLPDAIAHSAKDPHLARALSPAIEQAIAVSAREHPQPLAEALSHVIGRALRKSMARTLTPLITLGCAGLLVGGMWMFQTYRAQQQWNGYIDRLSAEPGIVIIQNGRRAGKFYVSGLRDDLAVDPSTLLAGAGLTADVVESRWEPYLALHPEFVSRRAHALLEPPSTVTLSYRDGVLTASGSAPSEWVNESRRMAPALAGVRRFEYTGSLPPEPSSEPEKTAAVVAPPDPPLKPQTVDSTLRPAPPPRAGSPESRLIEQIEVTTLVFLQTNRDLAPGQEAAVRRLATLFGELNEIAHSRGLRARVEVFGHTENGAIVGNRQLAKARADAALALFRGYKFDALVLASSADPVEETQQTDRDRNRRVSFKAHLLERF